MSFPTFEESCAKCEPQARAEAEKRASEVKAQNGKCCALSPTRWWGTWDQVRFCIDFCRKLDGHEGIHSWEQAEAAKTRFGETHKNDGFVHHLIGSCTDEDGDPIGEVWCGTDDCPECGARLHSQAGYGYMFWFCMSCGYER